MNKKSVIPIFLISLMVISLSAPYFATVKAETPAAYYPFSSTDFNGKVEGTHPTESAEEQSARYETFKTASDVYLASVMITLKSVGNPEGAPGTTGYLACAIYALESNAYNAKPTGSALVTANNQLDYDFFINSTWLNAQFLFNGTYLLESDTYYGLVFYGVNTALMDDSNYFSIGADASTPSYAGYSAAYSSSAWGAPSTAVDLCFELYGTAEPTPTPTPVPTPTPTPTDDYKWDENTDSWSWWNGTHWIPSSGPSPTANAQIVTFTGNMITYIVPLALLLLPAVVGAWALGKAGAAKWGFIAGLNIGAIMCYLYLPSFGLWAVIAIVLVDILMIFASQRGE